MTEAQGYYLERNEDAAEAAERELAALRQRVRARDSAPLADPLQAAMCDDYGQPRTLWGWGVVCSAYGGKIAPDGRAAKLLALRAEIARRAFADRSTADLAAELADLEAGPGDTPDSP